MFSQLAGPSGDLSSAFLLSSALTPSGVGAAGGAAAGGGGGGEMDWAQMAMLAASLSDKRLKENIKPISNALEKIRQLTGKTYNFTFKKPDNKDAGIMAQDLEKVLPEGVIELNGVKHIKLDAVIGLVVNAINELHEKIGRN